MDILNLKLKNFRNFEKLELEFPDTGSLLFGDNGTGKTNLLEAIAFFAFGKSIRGNQDVDLINFSKAFFHLEGNFRQNNIEYFLDSNVEKNKKLIKLNQKKIARISELFHYVKIIYFSPEDINIVADSPAYRRNFLDIALSQYSFQYLDVLRRYFHLVKQRNALLKKKFSKSEKRSWDVQFIILSEKIIKARLKYLEKIKPLLLDYFSLISLEKETIDLEYIFSFSYEGSLKESLHKAITTQEKNEIEQQRTLLGPHLADIKFYLNSHPVRKFASQGQMRSLAIALRLVQSQMIFLQEQDQPILMFDDVLADLDQKRAERILKLLFSDHQIFIASPNKKLYEDYNLREIDVASLI